MIFRSWQDNFCVTVPQNQYDGCNAMRLITYIFSLVLSFFVILSCSKKCVEPTPDFVYFNSFESPADTTGWHDIYPEMFVDNPAPKGGKQSLYIGGGCIHPTAYLDLPQVRSGYYTVSCWGKIPEPTQAGTIVLVKVNQDGEREEIELIINRKSWTFYRSKESLYCPANCDLRIEMYIGGIVGANMFIDCIGIEKAE